MPNSASAWRVWSDTNGVRSHDASGRCATQASAVNEDVDLFSGPFRAKGGHCGNPTVHCCRRSQKGTNQAATPTVLISSFAQKNNFKLLNSSNIWQNEAKNCSNFKGSIR